MPPLRLPDFNTASQIDTGPEERAEGEFEDHLALYEEAYAAGWEDAMTAQADAAASRAQDVARHLLSIGHSQDEARRYCLERLEPLLVAMAGSVLPAMARVALAPVLAETIMPLAEAVVDGPIRLRVAPESRATVEQYIAGLETAQVLITEDAALSGGQAVAEAGATEIHVDLDAVLESVVAAVTAFFEMERMEHQNAG